jgi:hypothetical protein
MNQSKNLPHLSSLVNLEKVVQPVLGGLYNFKQSSQAITSTAQSKHHEIQPITSVSTTVFAGTNNFVDVNVPKHLGYVEDIYAEITLANASDDTNVVLGAPPCFLFSRVEVRCGSKILETVRDVELFNHETIYKDYFHLQRMENSTAIDPTTFGVDTTLGTVVAEGSKTYRIPIRCLLNGLPISIVNDQITVRFYSQNVANVIASGTASDITCTGFKLFIRELDTDDNVLRQLASKSLDWRYLAPKHEETNIVLTSGSTSTYICNNFDDSDLCSHLMVLIRSTTLTSTGLCNYLDNATRCYVEDVSGQSLSNGIQWTNTQLLNDVYPKAFENMMSQTSNKSILLPLCPSPKPLDDFKRGHVNGMMKLQRNMKVNILANSSATRNVNIIAYVFRHVRIQGGSLDIF